MNVQAPALRPLNERLRMVAPIWEHEYDERVMWGYQGMI
jgi:hypothetical protein